MRPTISVFSGIYPPDTGGPAKFAETFREFGQQNGYIVKVFAYSDSFNIEENSPVKDVLLIDRNQFLISKYYKMIKAILREAGNGSIILANGSFWEFGIARIFKNFNYFTKVPGDIVWERARVQNRTNFTIDEFQENRLDLKFCLLRALFSYALRNSKVVIVPSNHLAKLAGQWGVPESKIAIINNSVKVSNERDVFTHEHKYDFVTVSRLVPWKGIDQVIREVSNLRASLLVIGDGPERVKLTALVEELRANVQFLGETEQKRINSYLGEASIFVLNSNFEATSYALLEAQAMGLIVIANEGTGSEQVITHLENGLLCGLKSRMNLAEAMKFAYSQGQSLEYMRIEAVRSVKNNFNLEINYRKILDICLTNQTIL